MSSESHSCLNLHMFMGDENYELRVLPVKTVFFIVTISFRQKRVVTKAGYNRIYRPNTEYTARSIQMERTHQTNYRQFG